VKRDPVQRERATIGRPRAVRVRVARRSDRAAITALWAVADRAHAELHPRYFRGDGRLDARLAEALDRQALARELFVAERGGAVVGFLMVEQLEAARAANSMRGRRAHIDTLVVARDARRLGCGRKLVEAAVAWARARRLEEILLTVWAGNKSAERFYTALGLQPISSVLRLAVE
jgi:ribosomal protein S18 acetylase RimI-like enzyme